MSKYRDLFFVVGLVFVYVYVFNQSSGFLGYIPLRPRTVYDIDISTTTLTIKQDTVSFENKPGLPVFNIFTELNTPDKFVVEKVPSKTQADYILVTDKLLAEKIVFKPAPVIPPPVKTEPVKPASKPARQDKNKQKPTETKKETKQTKPEPVVFSVPYLRELVKSNPKTYFYPGTQTGKDVVLSIVSSTKYEDKNIIKFTVRNSQKSYFFIASISISDETGNLLPAETYHDKFVSQESIIEGFVVVQRTKKLSLKLTESGGKQKCLEISFSLPGS